MKHAAAPTKCRAETSNAMRGSAPPATAPPAASCMRRDGGGGRAQRNVRLRSDVNVHHQRAEAFVRGRAQPDRPPGRADELSMLR
jgi:hypothetical protein